MRSKRSFSVTIGADKILERLTVGMPKLGYQQTSLEPLKFARGSKLGRGLSLWTSSWPTTVTIKLTNSDNDGTLVEVSILVPYLLLDEWISPVSHQLWSREMDFIEGIARSDDPRALESYQVQNRDLMSRDLAVWLLLISVLIAGAVLIAFAATAFSLFAIPFFQYTMLMLVGLLLFALTVYVYNRRARDRLFPVGDHR